MTVHHLPIPVRPNRAYSQVDMQNRSQAEERNNLSEANSFWAAAAEPVGVYLVLATALFVNWSQGDARIVFGSFLLGMAVPGHVAKWLRTPAPMSVAMKAARDWVASGTRPRKSHGVSQWIAGRLLRKVRRWRARRESNPQPAV